MRTHYCGQVTALHLEQTVTLYGWAHRRRDHGGVIFIDLRDREGLVQIVCDPDYREMFALAERVRSEFVLKVEGRVVKRAPDLINPKLATGEIEIACKSLEILNPSVPIPFQIDDEDLNENTRLTHRVLDLRRPAMQANLRLRYRTSMAVRKFMDARGFIDIETPMLTKSTPEGARDYLVPSRVHSGQFFALPQSPQLFKQMLMMAGFDRYYQITKCFRDEDLRADRQPEFTQIDVETSFLSEHEIRGLMEEMIHTVFREVLKVDLGSPFPIYTYADVMRDYGSDKPDLRVPLKFTELTDVMRTVDFKVFAAAANAIGGRVAGLLIPRGGDLTRGEIDGYGQFVGIYGAKGLAYIKFNEIAKGRDGMQSPIVKNLSDAALAAIVERSGAKDGDLMFFTADKAKVVNDSLGALRVKIGHEKGFVEKGWRPAWVIDFPMFEYDEEAKRWAAMHHPFTAPKDGHDDYLSTDPGKAIAKAYDMILEIF